MFPTRHLSWLNILSIKINIKCIMILSLFGKKLNNIILFTRVDYEFIMKTNYIVRCIVPMIAISSL